MPSLYYPYSYYLKNKYGVKTYKLPINLPVTCPNRDGHIGTNGCAFCSLSGTGFESLNQQTPIAQQLAYAKQRVIKRYHAEKFIAYFQNYTNTYLPFEQFKNYVDQAATADVVELSIATRPDAISQQQLSYLDELRRKRGLTISFEIGLQSSNNQTLIDLNRGHSVEDYQLAVDLLHRHHFLVCTHLILNLPTDTTKDTIRSAQLMNQVKSDMVKLHALYIAKNSTYGFLYEQGKLKVRSKQDYVNQVIIFLERLSPTIAIQRLIGRVPEKDALFSNWNESWWKIKETIEQQMIDQQTYQGRLWINEKTTTITSKKE